MRVQHSGQPNTFLHVACQNTGNLRCLFYFQDPKYVFNIFQNARGKGQMFILTLEIKSGT